VCVRVQRTVTPAVRIGPVEKFSCAILSRAAAQFGRNCEGVAGTPLALPRKSTPEAAWTPFGDMCSRAPAE